MIANTKHDHAAAHYCEAGEWLRKQRHYWQITQAELAEQIGNGDESLIDRIEQGEAVLPISLRDAIAAIFGVNRTDFAGYCEGWYAQETVKAA
jgi:ribosome-binding protein aMBF1 (putative translation factor)